MSQSSPLPTRQPSISPFRIMPAEQKLKVLAVDDNKTNLHILQVFLKKLGHQVILAENGEQALEKFNAEAPDLILLDIMMPVMDGFEAARRIRATPTERWVPIIFLSALNRDENLVEGLEAGADDYLTKPINFVVLEAKLRSVQRTIELQQQSIDALQREQTIANNVLEAIITIDDRGRIVTVNPAVERIFGWASDELIGGNVSRLMPDTYASQHDAYLARYLAGGEPHIIGQEREVEGLRKDGTVFPLALGVAEVTIANARMFVGVLRDISEQKAAQKKLVDNARLLQSYYDQTQSERQLALRLMEKQLHRKELQDHRLRYRVIPAEAFSGDIVAACRSPEGRFYALLADATGHGLTAAISALPVLALFYRMARINAEARELVQELNRQLRDAMPIGRFVAATLVCLDEVSLKGCIWVGGTPDAYLLDRWGRVARQFPSDNLPLGIADPPAFVCEPVPFEWSPESQLLMCSDGVIEAPNLNGEQFGDQRLQEAASNTSPGERFARIEQALQSHLGRQAAPDDVSWMLINCP